MKKHIADIVLVCSIVFLTATITAVIVTNTYDKKYQNVEHHDKYINVCYDNHKKLMDIIDESPEYNDSNDSYYQAINASEYVNDMCYIQTNNADIKQLDKYIEEYEKTFDMLSGING